MSNRGKHKWTQSQEVRRLRRDIERWRRGRKKRSPMPLVLWNTAAELAREHGACPVARTLHVDYKALRSRAKSSGVDSENKFTGFIELRPPVSDTARGHAEYTSLEHARVEHTRVESVLELSDAAGMKMVFRRTGGFDVDPADLVDAFRNPAR